MDRSHIDNQHVVARYLADQLSEDERREFESYMHAHPEIVHELEAAARLKIGLSQLERSGELATLTAPGKPWFKDSRVFAMAASVLVVLGLIVWLGRGFTPPTLVATLTALKGANGQPLTVADTYAILRTRSISYDADVELPSTPQAIELRVLPEVQAQPPRYRVTIARINDDDSLTAVGHVDGLIPADDEFVVVYFDSSKLATGRYELTVGGDAGTSAADQVSRFRIRLIPSAAVRER